MSTRQLIEDLIQATYDTGYLAGQHHSGTPDHAEAMRKRIDAKAALTAHVADFRRQRAELVEVLRELGQAGAHAIEKSERER